MPSAESGDLGRGLPPLAAPLLLAIAAAKLAVQFAGANHYGFFRDELYYIACGRHLAWGYIDQPPLIAAIAWLSQHLFGASLFATRVLPSLAGAAVVFLTGILARELGGGRYAQGLAAATALFAPVFLAFDSFLSMNAFEPLFWLVCAWLALRIVNGASPRLWLAFGAVAGIGLENKHTMAVFGFALIAGLVVTGHARILASKWLWLGGLFALALAAPNLLWESRHGWPQIEVVHNAQLYKNEPIGPLEFLWEEVLFLHPVALPVWLGGLAWLLLAKEARRVRFLGVAYLIVLAIFIGMHGKSYYAIPVAPVAMAAGGVALERWFANAATAPNSRWRTYLRAAFPTALIFGGIITLPFGSPILPVDTFLRYSQSMPYAHGVKTERDATAALPQLYADMFGWENMAQQIARVYHDLPPEERPDCAILAGNYGEAGAIDQYGPSLGLPKAISGHNSYYDWGPRSYSGSCVIIFGERADQYKQYFGESDLVATISDPHAAIAEQNVRVYVCRKPSRPLATLWPHFKMII